MQNLLMPKRYEKQIGKFTRADLLSDDEGAEPTNGNLYEPIEMHKGMRGGWRSERVRADHLNTTLAIGAAVAVGAGILAYILMKPRSSETQQ